MSDEEDNNQRIITIRAKPKPSKPIPKKDWCKTEASMQDRISMDKFLINDKLKNFDVISALQYSDIDIGTFIRYVTFDRYGNRKLRLGGFLICNNAPDYWVLRSGAKGKHSVTWSVNLKCDPKKAPLPNVYYKKKGMPLKSEKQQFKEEAFQAITTGGFRLVHKSLLDNGIVKIGKSSINLIQDHQDEDDSEERPAAKPRVKVNFT